MTSFNTIINSALQAGIREVSGQAGMITGLYPNPFSDKFIIDFYNTASSDNIEVNILDITGKSVITYNPGHIPAGRNLLNINVNNMKMANGLYLVTVKINGMPTKTMKLVKTNR